MKEMHSRYKKMEQYMSLVLIADLFLFIAYLIAAGNGIIWLKVILFIFTLLLAILCLAYLYLSQEITKQRSLWMTTAAFAIAICLLFSLVLNFPSPNPYRDTQRQSEITTNTDK